MKTTGLAAGWRLMRGWTLAAGLCTAALLVPAVHAADDDGGPNSGGAPARAVRLSSVDGQVQLLLDGRPLADHAVANTPLFEKTQIVTGNDGRAEIQFEDGSVARITPDSSLTLAVLHADGETELVLNGGLGYFELQGNNQGKPERVRFGDDVITSNAMAVLRVQMDQPPGAVAVFSGNAHLEGKGDLSLDLHSGETVTLDGNDPSQSNVAESIQPDSWDSWNSDRDQALATEQGGTTAATKSMPDSGNPAWSDLNANGNWYDVPDQGYVWSPYEASNPGWDPYGTGDWMSEPDYGYVWVSGEPWGYMPYNCGAWNYYGGFGWGWAPGGCQPWWGGGGGWGYNIGRAPAWYRKPFRPHGPLNPRPGGGTRGTAPPLIAVNRHLPSGSTTMLPARDRATPVTIAGNVVNPLRTTPVRPRYTSMGPGSRPAAGSQGFQGGRPGAVRVPEGSWPGPRPGASSVPRSAPAPAPRSTYSGGGGRAPEPARSSPPAAAPSGHPK